MSVLECARLTPGLSTIRERWMPNNNQVLEGKIQGGVFKAPLTFTATNEHTSVIVRRRISMLFGVVTKGSAHH
jgi:hypothetical protein